MTRIKIDGSKLIATKETWLHVNWGQELNVSLYFRWTEWKRIIVALIKKHHLRIVATNGPDLEVQDKIKQNTKMPCGINI